MRKQNGISMIELVMGTAIILFVLLSATAAVRLLITAQMSQAMHYKADKKLADAQEYIRRLSEGRFNSLESHYDFTCPLDLDVSNPTITCTDQDKKLTTMVEVHPVFVSSGTRLIVATATWSNGFTTQSKVLVSLLSPIRSIGAGGLVLVKMRTPVSDGEKPVPDVDVSAPGENYRQVNCRTDDTGNCLMYGVRLCDGGSPVPLAIDGFPGRHYFLKPGKTDPNEANAGIWKKTFEECPISAGKVNTFTYEIFPPGVLKGSVWHKEGAGVPDEKVPAVKITAVKVTDTLVIDNDTRLEEYTDAPGSPTAGDFSFDQLIPGKYTLHVIGKNAEWAAVGFRSETTSMVARQDPHNRLFTITSGSIWDSNALPEELRMITARRGSVKIKAKKVSLSSSFSPSLQNPTTTQPIKILLKYDIFTWLKRISDSVEQFSSPVETFAYKDFRADIEMPAELTFDSVSDAYVEKNHVTPWAILKSPLVETHTQGGFSMVEPSESTPDYGTDSYLPIVFLKGSKAKMGMGDKDWNFSVSKYTNLKSPGREKVLFYTWPNDLQAKDALKILSRINSTTEGELHYLSKSSLSNIKGKILDQDGVTVYDPIGVSSRSVVYLDPLEQGGIWSLQGGVNILEGPVEIPTTITASGTPGVTNTFTFKTGGFNRIPPTLGTKPLRVYYIHDTYPVPENKDFVLKIRAFYKEEDSPGVFPTKTTREFSKFLTSPYTVRISRSNLEGTVQDAFDVTVPATESGIDPLPEWPAMKAHFARGVGDVPGGLSPNSEPDINVVITSKTDEFQKYMLRIVQDSSVPPRYLFRWPSIASGPIYGYDGAKYVNQTVTGEWMEMLIVGNARIYGRVTDRDNVPVADAEVRIGASGFGSYFVSGVYPKTATNGTFDLSGVRFTMDEGMNLKLIIYKPGYLPTVVKETEAEDGYIWNVGEIKLESGFSPPPADFGEEM